VTEKTFKYTESEKIQSGLPFYTALRPFHESFFDSVPMRYVTYVCKSREIIKLTIIDTIVKILVNRYMYKRAEGLAQTIILKKITKPVWTSVC
jgi:hypothetical protein